MAAASDSKSAKSAAAAAAVSVSADFKFPEFYHFPPFFTLQPNSTTRAKQVAVWRDFILQYLAAHKQTALILSEEQKKPLFFNAKIDRKLPLDVCQMLVADLINQGYGEWSDHNRNACVISWRKFDDWAALIFKFAKSNNLINSVTTLYDLAHGDDANGTEFFGLDHKLLHRTLIVLEKQGRCTLLKGANVAETGVKFLDVAPAATASS